MSRNPITYPIFYVYVLFDWLGTPRYVGKGKNGRIDNHEKSTDPCNQIKNEFIEQTWIMLGEVPKLKVRENLLEPDALLIEIALIKAIGRLDQGTGPLVNQTDGGDGMSGYVHTEITKYKIRNSRTFKQRSITSIQSAALFTPEERSEMVRKGAAKIPPELRRERSLRAAASQTSEQLKDKARRAVEARTHEERKVSAQKGANSQTKEQLLARGRRAIDSQTPEQLRNRCLKGAASMTPEERITRALKSAASQTPEQLKDKARRAIESQTPEQLKERARKGVVTRMLNMLNKAALTPTLDSSD